MAVINGTIFADSLGGTNGDDQINGSLGNDTLKGLGGADRLDGGRGIDTAFYSDSNAGVSINLVTGRGFSGSAEGDILISIENIYGSAYWDFIVGDANRNEFHGSSGTDSLFGGGGDDVLFGEADGDDLTGGAGADRLVGGDGFDGAFYNDSPVGVSVSLLSNTASFGDAEGDTFDSIERVIGSRFADTLFGDDGNNTLGGLDGDDFLVGAGGDDEMFGGQGRDRMFGANDSDYLNGGAGDDTLDGGAGDDGLDGDLGNDLMRGGTGNDIYVVDSAADVVFEALGAGTDDVRAVSTYSLAAGTEIEILRAADSLGTIALDLVGNEFDQSITGNEGSNTIVGRLGLDVMTGRGAGDVFVWTDTAESGVAGNEADVITDFDRAVGDVIAVNLIDADVTIAGDQAFTFIGAGPFTAAGQISFFTTATDTYILLNTDGDAAQEMTIRLVGVHAVDASWFAL